MKMQHGPRLHIGSVSIASRPVHLGVHQVHWISIAMRRHGLHALTRSTRYVAAVMN